MRIVLALCLLLVATPAAARERLLGPTDDWRVEPHEEDCTLYRTFADSQQKQVRLRLQTFGGPPQIRITMVGDGLPLRDGTRGIARFKYRFKPGAEWRESYGTTGYSAGADALTFNADLSVDLAAEEELQRWRQAYEQGETPRRWDEYLRSRAAEIRELALAYPGRDDTVLQIGSLAAPIGQLDECMHDLWRQWGYEVDAIAALKSRPKIVNGQQIVTTLLAEMERAKLRQNDAIQFRLDVDAQGHPTGCTIQHPQRENALATLICDVIVRTAQVEPATDAAGMAVRAPLVSRVAFGV